jgi:hypothetical protein
MNKISLTQIMNKKISSRILIAIILIGSLFLFGCESEQQARLSGSVGGAGVPEAERSDAGMKEISGNPIILLAEGDTSETQAVIPETTETTTVSTTQVTTTATQTTTSQPASLPTAKPKGEAFEIFRIGNDSGVENGGIPAKFKTDKDIWVTELWTYHFNNSSGQTPGTIAIRSDKGTTYGPWPATTLNKVYWGTKPEFLLPAGSYSVIDSNPATWSQNGGSGGQGMSWMSGIVIE